MQVERGRYEAELARRRFMLNRVGRFAITLGLGNYLIGLWHFINDRRIAESSSKTAVMEGVEKGIVIGTEKGIVIGTEKGIEIGTEKGIVIGTEKGIVIGTEKGIVIGTEKGIVIGTEKGIEIGEKKNNRENARKMKLKGYSVEDIVEITGLSREEIEAV